jgi:hypothetical protein
LLNTSRPSASNGATGRHHLVLSAGAGDLPSDTPHTTCAGFRAAFAPKECLENPGHPREKSYCGELAHSLLSVVKWPCSSPAMGSPKPIIKNEHKHRIFHKLCLQTPISVHARKSNGILGKHRENWISTSHQPHARNSFTVRNTQRA